MQNNYIIRRIDSDDGEGRYYQGVDRDGNVLWVYPSHTTVIDSVYPMDDYLLRWIRTNGLAGQFEYEKAADLGTKIHISIEQILNGKAVPSEGMEKKEKRCIQAFIDWHNEFKPKILNTEQIVADHEMKVAGTRDLVCELDYTKGKETYKGIYVIDFKTGGSLQEKHKIQVTGYWKCDQDKSRKTALLHLGNRTKNRYSFLEFDPNEYLPLWMHMKKTWDMLYPDAAPSDETFPDLFTLNLPAQPDKNGTANK